MSNNKVSLPVIKRLPRYYRYIEELRLREVKTVSSKELAQMLGTTASQVRQDFNCFGGFGQQGIGYSVDVLCAELERLLFEGPRLNTILLGAGKLGQAISRFFSYETRGFALRAIFDRDAALVGQDMDGLTVAHVSCLEDYCQSNQPQVAVLCLPAQGAQEVIPVLIRQGIKHFWNFSHVDLTAYGEDILVENVHLADSLMSLGYRIRDAKR